MMPPRVYPVGYTTPEAVVWALSREYDRRLRDDVGALDLAVRSGAVMQLIAEVRATGALAIAVVRSYRPQPDPSRR